MIGSDNVCPFCGEADFDMPGLAYHLKACEECENAYQEWWEEEEAFRERMRRKREAINDQ